MIRFLLLNAFLFVQFISIGQCDIIYVSTSGIPAATGEMTDPLDLTTAVSTANAGDLIRIATGTYVINNPLTIPYDNIIMEGGFDDFNAWQKTSVAGATTIIRSNLNPEGAANNTRLVAVYANGITGFELHDLTITTVSGSNSGESTYGMHIQGCANYALVRCQVSSGDATNGMQGFDGMDGQNGSNGGNGAAGAIDGNSSGGAGGVSGAGAGPTGGLPVAGATNPAGAGNAGSPGNNGNDSGNDLDGGSGGSGGAGGETDNNGGVGGQGGGVNFGANQTGGGAAGAWGDPGGDGTNGSNGVSGASGADGAPGAPGVLDVFFSSGAQAGTGFNGVGGKGGVGGGGGGGQSCFLCDDGSADGGGGGGGGGQAGTGATGGYGGGGAFGIYLYNNGANGRIRNCNINSGSAGVGGFGGIGGNGGNGGIGGFGSTYGAAEVGTGGNGGAGGAGGDGGNGGNGSNGIASAIQLVSGDALVEQDDQFDLVGQPEITVDYVMCTNENTSVRDESIAVGSGIALWNFGGNANTQFSDDNPAITSFSTIGMNTIVQGANSYLDFVNITCSVDASATQAGTLLSATASGATYQWVDCNIGYFPIAGAISQTFTPAVTGSYAVIVTEGSCTDTSSCFMVDYTSLDEMNLDAISVYPNPTDQDIFVDFGMSISSGTVNLIDMTGRVIDQKEITNNSIVSFELNVPKGVYSFEILIDGQKTNRKFIKL